MTQLGQAKELLKDGLGSCSGIGRQSFSTSPHFLKKVDKSGVFVYNICSENFRSK